MKRDYVLGVLFFGALWGVSEAGLGGLLYGAHVPHSSVYLTLVAFAILAASRAWVPRLGTATLIGLFAMLFKFLNAPFWACHFAGIAMTGLAFDVAFALASRREGDPRAAAVAGFVGAFVSYAAFAVAMRYVIHYQYWVGPMDKFNGHLLNGAIAAAGCAIVAPLMIVAGRRIQSRFRSPFEPRLRPIGVATAALWAASLVVFSHTVIAG